MLTELLVANLGPIESAEIHLQPGSSALTGETGAGKTLIVTAVALLAGGRADRGAVRDGAAETRVEGRFVVPTRHPAVELLRDHDLLDADGDDIEIVIARVVGPSSSRARINGRLVPVSVLAEIGPLLVEITGQHEHLGLASARTQRAILDEFAGPDTLALASAVETDVRELFRLQRELEELRAGERERARQLDVLRFEIDEIEAAEIRAGEAADLTAEVRRLESAEEQGAALATAVDELSGEQGADDRVANAARALATAGANDPDLRAVAERIDQVAVELRDIGADLAARVYEPDPEALAGARDRLGEIARLRRKYGDDEAEILDHAERARTRLTELEQSSDRVERLETEIGALRESASSRARELSQVRAQAASRLRPAIEELLAELAMPGARCNIALEGTDLYEGGFEKVAFEIATAPGAKLRPMAKVASGGELSRIVLTLHLLARTSRAETMIFDEVDAGVGGAAARAVGEALARLGGDGTQVVVVTHLPQVAAFADAHYRVDRAGGDGSVAVARVDGGDRVEELSRMLAGLPESERAREHAQELLDLAAERGEKVGSA